ncbi:hypothetical protein PMI30_02036 [Pseudomonas sp. GM50]|jgi:hypothetical protein|nr:hypothetical protein PMI30_02036 [Pseudomonas sp. GM50]
MEIDKITPHDSYFDPAGSPLTSVSEFRLPKNVRPLRDTLIMFLQVDVSAHGP